MKRPLFQIFLKFSAKSFYTGRSYKVKPRGYPGSILFLLRACNTQDLPVNGTHTPRLPMSRSWGYQGVKNSFPLLVGREVSQTARLLLYRRLLQGRKQSKLSRVRVRTGGKGRSRRFDGYATAHDLKPGKYRKQFNLISRRNYNYAMPGSWISKALRISRCALVTSVRI
jgi:hypothetical protein